MTWKVEFDPRAEKELNGLGKKVSRRILKYLFSRIATFENPHRFGDPLRLNLTELWKYRIGDYRVICDIRDRILVVLVIRIGHRRNVYID